MSYFELLQESPELFVLVIILSLIITVLVYGAFPVIFAKIRTSPITKKKYKILCYSINIIVMVLFYVIDGAISVGPYVLWTWVFSQYGVKILNSKYILGDAQNSTKKTSTVAPQISSCEEISINLDNDRQSCHIYDTPNVIYCRKCGIKLPTDSIFCTRCGTKIITDLYETPHKLSAEEKAKREAEEKAKHEAEEKVKREAEEKAKCEAEEKAKREAEEKAKHEVKDTAEKENHPIFKKEKTLSEKLSYALMFYTDEGMISYLKDIQDESVQKILKSPEHLIREQIKNLLDNM